VVSKTTSNQQPATNNARSAIELINISKSFGQVQALSDITLRVATGEFVSVVGPSGSGKSTLFNLIVGLERPDTGEVHVAESVGGNQHGRVAYMPQRDALLPWRSVVENAVLPVVVQGGDVAQARAEARRLLGAFGLEGFGDALPRALSGGMRQRAALLRTVLWQRPVMLLDEPFGALDALTRTQLQRWLLELWADLDRTILFVTHDVEEALLLSDRVYVLTPRPGRIALELPVPLPRPRSLALLASPLFGQLKLQLHEALGL
jgi:ABC-type nitrate/sulfonate/bicarbonate transport system ATPase subunit